MSDPNENVTPQDGAADGVKVEQRGDITLVGDHHDAVASLVELVEEIEDFASRLRVVGSIRQGQRRAGSYRARCRGTVLTASRRRQSPQARACRQ